eukprot:scaffold8730_cov84-Isochrysis_galbana.AAC.1
MACLKALSGGSPMVPGVVCVGGYFSVCGRLSLGSGSCVGRVCAIYLRPMAHWKALSKGFPMVPGSVFVGGYFSVRGLLSLGLGWPVPLGSVSVYCGQGRVSVVFVLYLRPMAHWKALPKGFPMVPGS